MFLYYNRAGDGTPPKWYKFDDGDVSECKMDDDEVSVTIGKHRALKSRVILDSIFKQGEQVLNPI